MASTTAPPQHIRKRQFQPSISSYFARNASSSVDSRSQSPLSPPLPADTQASLLSVGMRVRKSVPEGYKTHKTLGTTGYLFPSTAPPALSAPTRPAYQPAAATSARELAPFCGLHKVGGFLAPQAPPPSSAPAAFGYAHHDFYDMPTLSMSQSTFTSTQDSFSSEQAPSSKKRTYEEEAEDDMDAFFDEIEAEGQESSIAARRMAKSRGKLKKAAAVRGVTIVDDDFEDAAFLAPMDVDDGGF